jgi:hypothetical protein
MATLLFSAIGTAIGGPIGGAIGSLVGSQVDLAIIGGPKRQGPRLKELSVTTSSYGTPIPRHFGRMRVAGSIVWATDLVEHRDRQGGGKGKPSVTTYSYSASFAVALSSRPILGLGRIWADGNLLRGQGGDLKAAGALRVHTGGHDQPPDPLIAAAEGVGRCPAFRGLAYAVFEDLQLADFGNRIPALTFEVFADEDDLDLSLLIDDAEVPLPGLAGFSCEGSLADALAMLDPVFPMDCDAGAGLVIARERLQDEPIALPEAAISVADGDFGGGEGFARRRLPPPEDPPEVLRYYYVDRDYQPGLQRAPGRPAPGQPRGIDLPGALTAADARALARDAARRAGWARETLSWRTTTLDARVAPGAVVTLPGQSGRWRVAEWEWRETGVELVLNRLPPGGEAAPLAADPGRANPPPDLAFGTTVLAAFELPWDGAGSGDTPALFAAVSAAGAGWTGAALFADTGDGELVPLGPSGRARSIMGTALDVLPPTNPLLLDRTSTVTVEFVGTRMALENATPRQLAMGANRALLGNELIQFARAVPLGDRRWRLEQLLRGRGGSEAAVAGHGAGETFVLLDGTPIALAPSLVGAAADTAIVAVGLGDEEPVASAIACQGVTLRPPSLVHARAAWAADGALTLRWTRRARGAWQWADGVDVPLREETEAYQVTYGDPASPAATWDIAEPHLVLTAAELDALPGASAFHVRQRGSYALSQPLFLTTLP